MASLRIGSAFALMALVVASRLALAGAPFGGDDTGCVPDTKEALDCEAKVVKLTAKLVKSIFVCHSTQALNAFTGQAFGEAGCSQAAKAKFDAGMTKLANGGLCPQAVLDNAVTQEGVLLADQNQTSPPSLDALNGRLYCDSASGALIADAPGDDDHDDTGWVPNSLPHLTCARSVAKNVSKLWKGLTATCHVKAAAAGFRGTVFDEEACENTVRSKYDAYAAKLAARVDGQFCPPCLDATGQSALADDIQSRADQENGQVFVCP